MIENCANCKYSYTRPRIMDDDPMYMECRFTAPVVIAIVNDDWVTVFPKVGPETFCGLWVDRSAEK